MYYHVIIKDGIDFYESNSLTFHFGKNFEEALNFAKNILNISEFNVEILQFEEDKKEE